jgi:hypothetical protein
MSRKLPEEEQYEREGRAVEHPFVTSPSEQLERRSTDS